MFDSRYYKILQDQILRDLTGFYPTKSYKILLYWARPKGYIVLGKFDYNIEIRPTKTTFHKKTWCNFLQDFTSSRKILQPEQVRTKLYK